MSFWSASRTAFSFASWRDPSFILGPVALLVLLAAAARARVVATDLRFVSLDLGGHRAARGALRRGGLGRCRELHALAFHERLRLLAHHADLEDGMDHLVVDVLGQFG